MRILPQLLIDAHGIASLEIKHPPFPDGIVTESQCVNTYTCKVWYTISPSTQICDNCGRKFVNIDVWESL